MPNSRIGDQGQERVVARPLNDEVGRVRVRVVRRGQHVAEGVLEDEEVLVDVLLAPSGRPELLATPRLKSSDLASVRMCFDGAPFAGPNALCALYSVKKISYCMLQSQISLSNLFYTRINSVSALCLVVNVRGLRATPRRFTLAH